MKKGESAAEIAALRREIRRLRKIIATLAAPLETVLQRKGFRVYRKNPVDDLLIPPKRFLLRYYRLLGRYSFRLFLRDVIKHQDGFVLDDVARYASRTVAGRYLEFMTGSGMVRRDGSRFVLCKRPVKSFGETLEWYVAEIFRREFSAEALWGVKCRRPRIGGDYDVLARFDGILCHVETKSSPPKQVTDRQVRAFIDRCSDLSADLSVFLMDTELRMKDKIVPLFEQELARMPHTDMPGEVVRIEKELFRIGSTVFIINAKDSITANLQLIVRHFYQARR